MPSRGTAAYTKTQYSFDGPDITPPLRDRTFECRTCYSCRASSAGSGAGASATGCSSSPAAAPRSAIVPCRPISSRSASRSISAPQDHGEIRGDHYYILSAGYLRQLGRLPDFMGGPIYAGGWIENGDAFETDDATLRTNASGGLILDTLVGPVMLAGSFGFDGAWRTYVGVGRLFGGQKQ